MAKIKKLFSNEPTVALDKRAELVSLLAKKTPGIFDREPSSGFNGNINVLADEIISLLSK